VALDHPKTNEDNVNMIKCNSSSMFLTPTNEMEVADIIKGIVNKKSTAVNDIPGFIMKKCYPRITNALTYIINPSFSPDYFPEQLKIAKVKPYQKECDTDVRKYRPVTCISGFSKIIQKIMLRRLLLFLYKHRIINNKRHGFCKGKSAQTATAEFTKMVYKSLEGK
jgi:hypothetical protein